MTEISYFIDAHDYRGQQSMIVEQVNYNNGQDIHFFGWSPFMFKETRDYKRVAIFKVRPKLNVVQLAEQVYNKAV